MTVAELIAMLQNVDANCYIGISVDFGGYTDGIYHMMPVLTISEDMPELAVLEIDEDAMILRYED